MSTEQIFPQQYRLRSRVLYIWVYMRAQDVTSHQMTGVNFNQLISKFSVTWRVVMD